MKKKALNDTIVKLCDEYGEVVLSERLKELTLCSYFNDIKWIKDAMCGMPVELFGDIVDIEVPDEGNLRGIIKSINYVLMGKDHSVLSSTMLYKDVLNGKLITYNAVTGELEEIIELMQSILKCHYDEFWRNYDEGCDDTIVECTGCNNLG